VKRLLLLRVREQVFSGNAVALEGVEARAVRATNPAPSIRDREGIVRARRTPATVGCTPDSSTASHRPTPNSA